MKCRKIQDLIRADYIDGELSERLKKEVEEHLAVCRECSEYAEVVKATAVEPLRDSEIIAPPERVWNGIKENIYTDERAQSPLAEWTDRLREVFTVRRPVLAAAVSVVMIFAVLFFWRTSVNRQAQLNSYLEGQMEALFYIDTNGNGYDDLGTGIEEFFM